MRHPGDPAGVRFVLVVVRQMAVVPPRSGSGELAKEADEMVDVVRRRAESEAGAHGAGQRRCAARSELPAGGRGLLGDAQQVHDQRMRAEAPVADADGVLGAQDRGEQGVG